MSSAEGIRTKFPNPCDLKIECFLFTCFGQYWGLNSRPRVCQASILPHKPHPQSVCFLVFIVVIVFVIRSHIFVQAGLQFQPPK
jgi:hypothetical protein